MAVSGLSSSRADELSDLRANQELLHRRIDQLAQVPPPPPAVGPGGPVMAGSFPRSFVIPGTEVSLRVGGQGVGSVLWYLKGAAAGGALNGNGGQPNEIFTDGQGGTGNLASIPLNTHTFSTGPNAPAGFAHSRSSAWEFSGKQTRVFLDARTPSPYGEVKAYVEFDFGASNTSTILNNNQGSTNGYIPRFRQGYATLGGLLMGQTTGTFVDNDSSPELLDFGGETGINFVARTPQARYTYPLPYGMSVAVAAENPDPKIAGPFGQYLTDTNQIPTESACAALTTPSITSTATGSASIGGTTAANNITNACLGNAAFFNASRNATPTFVGRWRIEQPWGHIQAGVTALTYELNDGMFLNKSYIGYGGALTGNFFTWGKDNLTWGVAGGDGIGNQIANNIGVATNFGGALAGQGFNAADSRSFFTTNRRLYDANVLATTIVSYSARVGYQHWWTPNLRSTIAFAMNHNDIPALVQASGRAANNKELNIAHANLVWSPVAFVDLGVEGAWGHRVVVSNLKGDAWTLQTSTKFRF
ncbi:MAG TPA: DcaP family trimeric outer membrane transporter [Sphingomicrobium sp.]|nr:DcaP family trimeric outer membrane transporter [Sphingomicrobium sp.]